MRFVAPRRHHKATASAHAATAIALSWAGSEIPPLNAVARAMSAAKGLAPADNARLFAVLNFAVADALIAGFEAKYRFNTWRPITAIRAADSKTIRAWRRTLDGNR